MNVDISPNLPPSSSWTTAAPAGSGVEGGGSSVCSLSIRRIIGHCSLGLDRGALRMPVPLAAKTWLPKPLRVGGPMLGRHASASFCDAFQHPAGEGHARSAPYVSLLEGPGVDRAAVADEVEQAWLAELLGRPLVQALQARHDDRVVEHPAKPLLVGDVAVHVERERIAVGQHAA